MMSSLSRSLSASAIGCNKPCGPTRIGPRRTWKSASTLRSTSVMYPATSGKTAMITMVTASGTKSGCWRTVCMLFQQRTLGQAQHRLGINADGQRQHAGDPQRDAQTKTGGERRLLNQLAGEHDLHHAEIVVDRDRDIERSDHRQIVVVGLDQREKNVVLAQEPRGRRDAG